MIWRRHKKMIFKSGEIYFENGARNGYLVVEDGRIADYLPADAVVDSFVDYSGYRIIPGIIDTHNHGTRGYGVFGIGDADPGRRSQGFLKRLCSRWHKRGYFPTAHLPCASTSQK
jgi:N-acetylglucosamine-6-phosphate deacetylase